MEPSHHKLSLWLASEMRGNILVMFSGWVFFLTPIYISLGGQAQHVLRAQMWALNTCGEPNEIELTAAHGLVYLPPPFQAEWLNGTWNAAGLGGAYVPRAVQFHPHGGQFDYVWPPARTTHPHVGPQYVRRA